MTPFLLGLVLAVLPPVTVTTYHWEQHYQDDYSLVLYRDGEVVGLYHVWRRDWCPAHESGYYFLEPQGAPPVPVPDEPRPQGPRV